MPSWIEALKIWNKQKGGKYVIPKKGTPEYEQVRAVMGVAIQQKKTKGKKSELELDTDISLTRLKPKEKPKEKLFVVSGLSEEPVKPIRRKTKFNKKAFNERIQMAKEDKDVKLPMKVLDKLIKAYEMDDPLIKRVVPSISEPLRGKLPATMVKAITGYLYKPEDYEKELEKELKFYEAQEPIKIAPSIRQGLRSKKLPMGVMKQIERTVRSPYYDEIAKTVGDNVSEIVRFNYDGGYDDGLFSSGIFIDDALKELSKTDKPIDIRITKGSHSEYGGNGSAVETMFRIIENAESSISLAKNPSFDIEFYYEPDVEKPREIEELPSRQEWIRDYIEERYGNDMSKWEQVVEYLKNEGLDEEEIKLQYDDMLSEYDEDRADYEDEKAEYEQSLTRYMEALPQGLRDYYDDEGITYEDLPDELRQPTIRIVAPDKKANDEAKDFFISLGEMIDVKEAIENERKREDIDQPYYDDDDDDDDY